jgi:hypothetical protein
MEIKVLQGTEESLYGLIAPLVMNPNVLRQNDNVAFKTTEKHVWIVAMVKQKCVGFLPIQRKKQFGEINNYYIRGRNREIFSRLLTRAERQVEEDGYSSITIITQKMDYEIIRKLNYQAEKVFINYTRFTKKL